MEQHPEFIDSLIALKNYYQVQIEEYQRQFAHAKKHLSHVNALLDDQMARQYKHPTSRQYKAEVDFDNSVIASETRFGNCAIASASNLLPDTSPPVAPSPDLASTVGEPQTSIDQPITLELTKLSVDPVATEATVPLTTDLSTTEQPVADFAISERNHLPSVEPDKTTEAISSSQLFQQPIASPVANDLKIKRSRQGTSQKTPLLPPYQHLSKSEAVEKFLQDNEGKAFYIDNITLALYGELEADAIQAERPRISGILKKGVAKGFWQAMPDTPNYYTFDLNSVQPQEKAEHKGSATRNNQLKERKFRGKPALGVLPRYQNLSWSQAVETVITEQVRQILTTDKITQLLCGDLSGEALKQAKEKIARTLWSGANQGLWQRVPGQEGKYTMDLNQLT